MLDVARRTTEEISVIEYRQTDLEKLRLEKDEYNVVFSSLVLHYISNLRGLMMKIHQSLKPGGSFVFSVEHPTVSAPKDPNPQ